VSVILNNIMTRKVIGRGPQSPRFAKPVQNHSLDLVNGDLNRLT